MCLNLDFSFRISLVAWNRICCWSRKVCNWQYETSAHTLKHILHTNVTEIRIFFSANWKSTTSIPRGKQLNRNSCTKLQLSVPKSSTYESVLNRIWLLSPCNMQNKNTHLLYFFTCFPQQRNRIFHFSLSSFHCGLHCVSYNVVNATNCTHTHISNGPHPRLVWPSRWRYSVRELYWQSSS